MKLKYEEYMMKNLIFLLIKKKCKKREKIQKRNTVHV